MKTSNLQKATQSADLLARDLRNAHRDCCEAAAASKMLPTHEQVARLLEVQILQHLTEACRLRDALANLANIMEVET